MRNVCREIENNCKKHKISKFLLRLINPLFLIFIIYGSSDASEISARAAVLLDSVSGTLLYAKNPDLKLPPASTTKLVTAMVVLDNLDPESFVTVSRRAANTYSVEPRLDAGQVIQVKDLLYLALMRSVNSAAVAIAEAVAGSEKDFVLMMNQKVRDLGVMNTRFVNASGLPGRKQYTTARDIAEILKQALKYSLIADIIGTRVKVLDVNNKHVLIKNTNFLLWTDNDQIGGKTGYTAAARHCFVSAARKGDRTLIVALLGEPVRKKLWSDAKRLIEKGYEVIVNKVADDGQAADDRISVPEKI